MALALWFVFRRSRSRPKLVVAAAPLAKLAAELPLAEHDERHASPEPLEPVGRDLDAGAGREGVPLAEEGTPGEHGASNPDEHFAPLPAANLETANQSLEIRSIAAMAPATPSGIEGSHTDDTPATAALANVGAAVIARPEVQSETAVLTEREYAPLPQDGPEETLELETAAADEGDFVPAPDRWAGPKALASGGFVSRGPVISPPDEAPVVQDARNLANAIGEAVADASATLAIAEEVFAEPDEAGDAPGQGGLTPEEPAADEPPPPSAAAEPPEAGEVADDLAPEVIETGLAALPGAEVEPPPATEGETPAAVVPASRPRPSKPAQHRDRRGQRRPALPKVIAEASNTSPTPAAVLRTPAEARLRLIIHPVRRTVSISAVLARPAGYPDSITLLLGAETEVGAFGDDRYDDVDLEWTPNLLSGEVRLDSREGYQWLRSSRRIHIFSEQADEQGLMSVGSATLNSASAVVCTQEDAEAVRSAAAAWGSPELVTHDRWSGVPEGWAVLSRYRPTHAAPTPLDPYLKTLDPGIGTGITLSGGLHLRSGSFAQGSPPRIEIRPFPAGAQVTIDGMPADMDADGSWRATGWDGPGDHVVDVVPGPSLTYRIIADPWTNGGWESWDAHAGRFELPNDAPWARAQICGASVSSPSGEHVVAAEPRSSVVALGLRRGVAMLRVRPDAPIAVGLLREAPAFLISSSGPRRVQGRVEWLVPPAGERLSRVVDLSWVAAVRSAASRRLSLSTDSPAGQEAWRRARARARRHRKGGA